MLLVLMSKEEKFPDENTLAATAAVSARLGSGLGSKSTGCCSGVTTAVAMRAAVGGGGAAVVTRAASSEVSCCWAGSVLC